MLCKSDLIITRGQLKVLGFFSSTGHYLVVDQLNEQVGILKILKNANINVYSYLLKHSHRNVCAVYDFWEQDGRQFVLEEYLPGRTLDECFLDGIFSKDEAVDILGQICDGVNFLHTADPPIIHKDLKLINIMIDRAGIVKIIDFDISRIYQKGAVKDTYQFGTTPFASPEHYGFGQTNVKSDQYAIGQMMREMGLEHGHLANVIKKATQIDPDNRYKDIVSMKRDIMKSEFHFWPVPGFRTHTAWKMIVSLLGYLSIIWFSFFVKYDGLKGIYEVMTYRVVIFLMLLTEVDLFTKWSPIFNEMPFLHGTKTLSRILWHVFTAAAIIVCWSVLLIMIVSFCK